jgi:hypothetical protein
MLLSSSDFPAEGTRTSQRRAPIEADGKSKGETDIPEHQHLVCPLTFVFMKPVVKVSRLAERHSLWFIS